MKMIKKLTKANCSKYGIEAAPEYDFEDDGNKFRGFIYKGLPMTQCYSDGVCYLSIRVDYLKTNFTYKEWMATYEYHLCDILDGTPNEFDPEVLVEDLEKILAKVNEMNANAKVSKAELEEVKNITAEEVKELESFLNNVRSNFEWCTAKPATLRLIADYCNTIDNKIRRGLDIINNLDTMEMRKQKEYIDEARRAIIDRKYRILSGTFYMEQVTKLANLD